jgi:DNA-binding LacI/PurR family transcriptional regulator
VPLVPHVYVNRRGPDPGHDVVMDEAEAVRLYIDHASELGHRSVALIDGPAEVDTVYRRVSAARRICAARGVRLTVRRAARRGGWLGRHDADAAGGTRQRRGGCPDRPH